VLSPNPTAGRHCEEALKMRGAAASCSKNEDWPHFGTYSSKKVDMWPSRAKVGIALLTRSCE
jgi:hypothetical protein